MSTDITCLFCGKKHDIRIGCPSYEVIRKSPYVKVLDKRRIDLQAVIKEATEKVAECRKKNPLSKSLKELEKILCDGEY